MNTFRAPILWLLHAAHRKAIDARRRGRRGAYLAYAVLSGITQAIALGIALAMFLALWSVGLEPFAIVLGVVGAAPFAGPWLIRHVLVPLGLPRVAHWVGYTSIAAGKDATGYGLVAAAWAHLHRPSAAGETTIDKLRTTRGMTGDAEIVATGLVALARGDVAAGRQLIASVGELAERHPAVREIAAECLAAIDVEAGAFAAILARAVGSGADTGADGHRSGGSGSAVAGDGDAWPASPLTFLIEGCAQRITGDANAPTAATLWSRWILAPRRRATRALVARAIAAAPSPRKRRREAAEAPAPVVAPPSGAPFPAAMTAHIAALRARRPDRDALAGAARAWDAALADPDTRLWMLQRAAELAAPSDAGDVAARELRAQVAADLAELAETAQIATVDDGSAIATEIARAARGQRLATLELAFAAWEDRARARTPLPAIDEWRAFLALRASYDQAVAVGGLELRRLAFPHALTAGGVVSAWLWNQRKEFVLSHAISVWLLAEARAVGDASAIEHESHNAKLTVPTRTG